MECALAPPMAAMLALAPTVAVAMPKRARANLRVKNHINMGLSRHFKLQTNMVNIWINNVFVRVMNATLAVYAYHLAATRHVLAWIKLHTPCSLPNC